MATPEHRTSTSGEDSWRVRYRLGGRQLSRTFYTADAAQQLCDWIAAFGVARALELDDLENARLAAAPPSMTLDEWAERYIGSLTGASSGTKAGYRSTYKHSFGRLLGGMRLDQLNRELIATAVAKLTTSGGRGGDGYSDKSIKNQHGLLSAMLDTAARDRHIQSNPCEHVALPRRTEHADQARRFLTEDEFWRLWDSIGAHHRPLLELLVGTGIRWGEAEALLVSDVDVEARTLRVSKAFKNSGNKSERVVGPTKTRRSNRTITLDDELAGTLEAVVHGRGGGELLMLAPGGGRLNNKTFWQDAWTPAARRAGLNPRPRIHDLRHTHASWLIAEDVPMKVVQERLGHESLKTTMDLYAHLLPGAQQEAAAAMGRIFGRRPRPGLRAVGGVA